MPQQIPTLSIVFMCLSAFIAIVAPVVLWAVVRQRKKARFVPVLVGAATFILSALVLESMVLQGMLLIPAFADLLRNSALFYSLTVALMAGLFEETGRLIAFTLMRKKYNNLSSALAYGVGHGGIESILLVGLSLVGTIISAILFNGGGMDSVFALLPGQQSEVALESFALLSVTPTTQFLAAGIERLAAIAYHMAASILVWLAASGRGSRWLFPLAILFHACVNFPAGLYQYGTLTSIWLVEGIVAVTVAVICMITYRIWEKCSQMYSSLLNYEPVNY